MARFRWLDESHPDGDGVGKRWLKSLEVVCFGWILMHKESKSHRMNPWSITTLLIKAVSTKSGLEDDSKERISEWTSEKRNWFWLGFLGI